MPSKHLPGALFTETLDVDCAITIGINVLHTINSFLIKLEILNAFTSYCNLVLLTTKHRNDANHELRCILSYIL